MAKKLYERDLYTIPDVDYIISQSIIEYDMKNAGYNLIKYFGLLPESKIEYLSKLSKRERTIQIGKFERDDRDFAKELTKSFARAREMFFEENSLDDNSIIAIKKDAIFVTGKECQKTKFGNIEFAKKHRYTSYHKFDNIEMYYRGSNNTLDIKGIRDELLTYHEKYFIAFLKRVFGLLEHGDQQALIKFMKRFISDYKTRKLDIGYYRELSVDSVFSIDKSLIGESNYYKSGVENIDDCMINHINIAYNYTKYVLPIMQRFYLRGI